MKTILLSAVTLVILSVPAASATCYRSNPAGGQIPYECVRLDEHKVEAPSLGKSSLPPTMDQGEIDMILKQMDPPAAVQAVPAVPARQ